MCKKQKKHRMNEMYCWKKNICVDFNLGNERILWGENVSMAFSTSQMPKNLVKSRVEDE